MGDSDSGKRTDDYGSYSERSRTQSERVSSKSHHGVVRISSKGGSPGGSQGQVARNEAKLQKELEKSGLLPKIDIFDLGTEYGKGNCVFSGPNGIGYSRYSIDPNPLYVGFHKEPSDLLSLTSINVLNAPKWVKIQQPRHKFPGEIGWSTSLDYAGSMNRNRNNYQYTDSEAWHWGEDLWGHRYLNPYYPYEDKEANAPANTLPPIEGQPALIAKTEKPLPSERPNPKHAKSKFAKYMDILNDWPGLREHGDYW